MKKSFIVILLMCMESLFAETWTQILKGFDCYENCDAYADSSNVLYGKYYISHKSNAEFATIVFNDSAMLFGTSAADYSGNIYFSLYEGVGGCGALGSGNSYCEYSFTVSTKNDSINSKIDSIWFQKKPNFLFEDTLDLMDSSSFMLWGDIEMEFLTEISDYYLGYGNNKKGWCYKEEEVPLSSERRYYYLVNDVDSIYFVYRKDTSYFAYCLMLQSINCNSFQLQCVFQTDSLPYFPAFDVEPYPYPSWSSYWISSLSPKNQYHSGTCLTKEEAMAFKAEAIPSHRRLPSKNVKGKSFLSNGSQNLGNHTGVFIENGKAKIRLKK